MRANTRSDMGNAIAREVMCAVAFAVVLVSAGCGSPSGKTDPPPSQSPAPQTYFAAAMSGAYAGESVSDSEYLSTYTIDDSKDTVSVFAYTFGSGDQQGPQLDYSGTSSALTRGWLSLAVDYSNSNYGASINAGSGIYYNPPLGGNYAFELAHHDGGFVSLKGMPFVPIAAAEVCPASTKAVTYQFVSLPAYMGPDLAGLGGGIQNWDPQVDTAYGTVQISAKGDTDTFNNIKQFLADGTQLTSYEDVLGKPAAVQSIAGLCSSTFYGETISVPGSVTITNPGVGETIESPAIVAVSPAGLLLENDGETSNLVSNAQSSGYQPFLGSGTGAIGLPQPSSAVDVAALTGAQYIGTVYGGGSNSSNWTSLLASFGFPSAPSDCPSGPFQHPLFGGDFPGNDPTQSPLSTASGYGNCDVAIDLGQQDSSNNGLFRNATVYLSSAFAGNTNHGIYSFPATAIAGQLNGKYAVFAIGVDTTGTPNQAWGVYLFQSN